MPTFKCLRCADCCKNLRVPLGNYEVGLFLLPTEIALFPPGTIAPMWAIDTKGKRRPGRPKTIFYQMTALNCPNLTRDGKCLIYKQRPTICRSYPLTIHMNGTASIDTKCQGCHKADLYYSIGVLQKTYPKDLIDAQIWEKKIRDLIEFDKEHSFDIPKPADVGCRGG